MRVSTARRGRFERASDTARIPEQSASSSASVSGKLETPDENHPPQGGSRILPRSLPILHQLR